MHLSIYYIQGKIIESIFIFDFLSKFEISTSSWQGGMYFYKIQGMGQTIKIGKLIKMD